MREVILTMSMSLDGFVSGPDGDIDWMFGTDQEAIAWKLAAVSDASLHIMGSRTFRTMAGFWPTATTAFASPMNRIPKAVFSSRGPSILPAAAAGAESWSEAYVAGGDLAEEIARLKAQDGKPIRAHGGASFAGSLVARGLVDQYCLLVHPILLGHGAPIFRDLPAPRRLGLVSAHAFPGGAVAQIYRPD